ncbi:MAG TPA: hypothetical protein VMU88_03670 [bacterium]|nr:hypothetical protein [bacterium]
MKKTWFWATLVFWCVFSSAVISRALIFAPLSFQPQMLRHFETRINGRAQRHDLWVNDGALNRLIPLIEAQYGKQGWKPVASGMDLAPEALGFKNPSVAFPDSFQLKLFQREGLFRVLGLWQSPREDKTYGWACDTPPIPPSPEQARPQWGFPLRPPAGAVSIYQSRIDGLAMAFFILPGTRPFQETIDSVVQSQGFQATPYYQDSSQTAFLLQKNKTRLLAQAAFQSGQTSIAVIDLSLEKETP